MRTSLNLTKYALREFQSSNPKIREDGAKRLIGFGIAAGGIDYGLKTAFEYAFAGDPEKGEFGLNTVVEDEEGNRISGSTPDEKMSAAQRSYAPTWNETGFLVPVGVELNKEGKPVYRYFNMSYQSPYTSTIIAPFFVGVNTFQESRYEGATRTKAMLDASFRAFGTMLAPFVSESIFGQRLADVTLRGGKKLNGGYVWYEEDDLGDKWVKGAFHLAGAYTPGIVPQATRTYKGVYNFFTKEDRDMYYTGRKGKGDLPYSLKDSVYNTADWMYNNNLINHKPINL